MRECEGRFDYLSRGPGIRGGEVVHSYSYHHHPLGDRLEYLADPTFPKTSLLQYSTHRLV